MFLHVKTGDRVRRLLPGEVTMELTVTKIDGDLIHCGPWTFDRATGLEVDDEFAWGPAYRRTGSMLVGVVRNT